MSTLCVIQARYNSTRLPGKVLEPIGGVPVIEHVVRRAIAAVPDVVVALPNTPRDARIFDIVRRMDTPAYMHEGDEDDVLGRFVAVAREYRASTIVRITADCPFIDPAQIALMVDIQRRTGADFVSNSFSGMQVDGLDVEVFSRGALDIVAADETDPSEREHVTPSMRRLPHRVLVSTTLPLPCPEAPHRWTLDTEDDLLWMREVARHIDVSPPAAVVWKLVKLLSDRPSLARFG